MIDVKNLSKHYGDRPAISNLNFSVKKGEVVGFLGPNGAGKSTTMKIITGAMAPSSGQVVVAGFDVFEDPIEVKKRIGYLPETPPVYFDMEVEEYLTFVATLKGVESGRKSGLVQRALEKAQLIEVRRRWIANLSKGFKQRVGLAQALVSDPEVLILDEPTVGLDPKQMAEIRQLIAQLKGQHTIVLSTHILSEVQASCDKVIIINRGHIIAEDSLEGLSRRMTGGLRLSLKVRRAAESLSKSLAKMPGVHGVNLKGGHLEVELEERDEVVEAVAAMAVEKSGLLEMKSESVSLEDIFIQLTSEKVGEVNA
jgi:ABC-2 type transport system ATP-binding protein